MLPLAPRAAFRFYQATASRLLIGRKPQLAALLAVLSRENLETTAPLKARLQHVEIIVIVLDVEHFGGRRFPSCLTAPLITLLCAFHPITPWGGAP